MKKHLLALLLLLAAAPAVRAQDWLESLKKVATAAADKAADGKLTQSTPGRACASRATT